ncbi:hypothetical protein [Methylophaga sp.]|uniref:hypothetical protein n=1 Tax=Methylophaga sp. TaxID=2024840 RepID=UPI003A918240
MTIKEIRIVNVKGISDRKFPLSIISNKPSLLVAPNGFGKSSFCCAFSKLNNSRILLDDDSAYQNDISNLPELILEYIDSNDNNHVLAANNTTNGISDHFDWFVINNKIKAKGVGRNYGGRTSVTASIELDPVVLVDTIPCKKDFDYSYSGQKECFGNNAKILPNINVLFSNMRAVNKLSDCYSHLDKLLQVRNSASIESVIFDINSLPSSMSKNSLLDWFKENKKNEFEQIESFFELVKAVSSANLGLSEEQCYFAVFQIRELYKSNKSNFKAACKYNEYLLRKSEYEEILSVFNTSWCSVKPQVKGSKLIVNFPKAHKVSNGQRDIISFVALLHRAKNKLKGESSILIIDEVFDYLDDANLVAAQYYITLLIEEFKRENRRIYPLIFTHLNPLYFKNYAFKDQKVYFLDKREASVSPHFVNLLRKRKEALIESDVSQLLLHYHPEEIDKRDIFRQLSLKETWGEGRVFERYVMEQAKKYVEECDGYDPLAVCCAVRLSIEKSIYIQLSEDFQRSKFIEEHGTRKKLYWALECGVDVPEHYFLLGILYNDGMHWHNNQDNISPVVAKLENQVIKSLVSSILN